MQKNEAVGAEPHFNSSSFQHFVNADKCRFPLAFSESLYVIYLHFHLRFNTSSLQLSVRAAKCRFPLAFFDADSFFVIYLHLVNVSTPHLFSILYGKTSAGFFLCVLFVYYFYLFCFWKDNRVVKSNFLMQQQMLPVQTLPPNNQHFMIV